VNEELQSIEAVSRAVDRITRRGRTAEFELSNGIVLLLKPVPPLLVQAVTQEYQPPSPPKVFIEEKGREEENPNDPEYLRNIERLANEQELAVGNLILGVGTSVKSVPDGYFMPNDDNWIAQVEFASKLSGTDLKIEKEDTVKRYLCWLRYYAMETGSDVALCTGITIQLAGIQESEIEEVVDSFRGVQERGPNTESTVASGSENGHTANRASRRSSARN
jgi:hypothetical protein